MSPIAAPGAPVQEERGVIEGYASLFDRPDSAGDVIRRGAFAESLSRRGPAGVRFLYQHKSEEPIGLWEILREDARGLYVRGRIFTGVRRGRDALCLLREGALDGLSVGFRTQAARPRARGRVLLKVDLLEISLVTFPMMPGARARALTGTDAHAALLTLTRATETLNQRSA